MKPKVTLLSWTRNPVGTIYALWQASRNNEPCPDPNEIDVDSPEVMSIFQKVVNSKIPVTENINFVFLLENVSISFREQMVRHRVGVKVGERLGVDIIPELGDSTWWSQTMRVLDMSKFYDNDAYRTPETLEGKQMKSGPDAKSVFQHAMEQAQWSYRKLLETGVPAEDAREVLPMATQHRVSWALNLTSLQHIVGKRTCWIAQSSLWGDVIKGMVDELATKVHPYFRNLVNPPCFAEGEFKACCFKIENERRVTGEDPIPPCSLYLHHHTFGTVERPEQTNKFMEMREWYGELWNRNPDTGKPLED